MDNKSQVQAIGSGILYPFKLVHVRDENGVLQYTEVNGELVPLTTIEMVSGDIELVKQNLKSLFSYQIGQKIREEYYGTRLYEVLEEPSTLASEFLITKFIEDAIYNWEPRVTNLSVKSTRNREYINVLVRFQVGLAGNVEELNFDYNHKNNIINAY